jgi:acetylornithine/N-succinyldiaminopimelate aminotransferase
MLHHYLLKARLQKEGEHHVLLKMKLNDRIEMVSFNGGAQPEPDCDPSENYWKLIGSCGTVAQDPTQSGLWADFSFEPRYLIVFDAEIDRMGLANHNPVPNSLWILETDLVSAI